MGGVVMAEFSALVALALPSMLSTYCFFAISITELSVVGHLGVDQLAAVAYAQMGLDLTTLVFMQGFNAGMTALCSQAFGAKNYHLLGRYAMLTGFCLTIMCVPMAILWWNLGAILNLAGVEPQVVQFARTYARLSILWLWPRSMFQVLSSFYQSQQIVIPTTIANAISVVVNLVLVLGLTHGRFGFPALGFIGCPIGTMLALSIRLIGYAYYMNVYKQYHRLCAWHWNWHFLNKRVFINLINLGVPLAAGTLFENMQLLTMTLFASKIGEVQLGTHNSMMELFFFATSPIYGVINGSVTRIGAHLGADNPVLARLGAQLAAVCIFVLSTVNGAVVVGFSGSLGRIFSEDPQVIASFAQICSLCSLAYFILGFFYYAIVVLQAQARPAPLMIGFMAGAWLVGVPTAYYLALGRAQRSFVGIWYGMLCGYTVTAFIGFYGAFWQTDWRIEASKAAERSKKKHKRKGSKGQADDETRETDPLLP